MLLKPAVMVLCAAAHLLVPGAELCAVSAGSSEGATLSRPTVALQSSWLPRASGGEELSATAHHCSLREPMRSGVVVANKDCDAVRRRVEQPQTVDRTQCWLCDILTRTDDDPPA